ncbi:MAG TPA: sodium:solute symporter family protein [Thermoanaerobaculia bacterium]|nr:sodium:solute symporter family protein [Thermoanaerobaculia bacterium]
MTTPSAIALPIIFALVALGSAIGFVAGARYKMDLEQWTVAGRGFGVVFVWLLMAGEVYTTFSFLGASGWAYSRGGPTLYILAYLALGYVTSYYFLPQMWEVASEHRLQTTSDFFVLRYDSRPLGALVALVSVAFMIPYLQLQLTGLGIIVEVASFEGISRTPAMLIAGVLIAAFVFMSGMRAVAWVSVLKDFLLLSCAITIGIIVPYVWFGGIGPMFASLAKTHAAHLVMPGSTKTMGHAWFVSTVLLTSFGFYMWPHTLASVFSAKSSDTIRRNAIAMPVYGLSLPFVFFAGFAALVAVPHLKDSNLALLTVVRSTFPAWFLGVVGGAGALTAMVPAAIIILTASTLFAKNFWRPLFAPSMDDQQVARLARVLVVAITAVALWFSIHSSPTLVALLLLGYAGITQFFPGVILGLYWRRASRTGVFAGIATGVAVVAFLMLTNRDPYFGINAGFIALCLNFLVMVGISAATRERA